MTVETGSVAWWRKRVVCGMLGQCSPTNAGPRWGRVSSVNEWLKIGTHSPKKWFRHLPWIALKKDWRGPFLKEKRAEPTKYIQVYPSIGTYFTVFWAASQCFYVFCFVLMINDEAQREAGIRSVVRSQRILWYKVSTINKINCKRFGVKTITHTFTHPKVVFIITMPCGWRKLHIDPGSI